MATGKTAVDVGNGFRAAIKDGGIRSRGKNARPRRIASGITGFRLTQPGRVLLAFLQAFSGCMGPRRGKKRARGGKKALLAGADRHYRRGRGRGRYY